MGDLADRRLIYGFLGSALLILFYAGINYLTGGSEAVYWNLKNYLPYIAIIDMGFGLQIALFTHIRSFGKSCNAIASTSVTGGSMVACCLHHITDFIPFLGAGLFLSQLTEIFFMVGAASSIIGTTWMLSVIQKGEMYSGSRVLSEIMRVDYSTLKDVLIVLSAIAILWKYLTEPYMTF